MFREALIGQFFNTLDKIEAGSFTITGPDNVTRQFSGRLPGENCSVRVSDWRTLEAIIAKGDIGLAESYRNGWWDTNNLTALLTFGLQNEQFFGSYIYGGAVTRLAFRFLYLFSQNNLYRSKKNVQAHYDLGNDFYKLWLDPGMSYSSALFKDPYQTLEQAQNSKYDRILEKLGNSGDLLEIGCGWGAFAERALQQRDYRIKGVTLSQQQHQYCRERIKKDANIVIEDYRVQKGKYDHIVSIEMFEAVGEKFWSVYFSKIASLLKTKGKALIQTITIGEPYFERYRKSGDMIRTFIFPGGMLPTEERFSYEARQADLQVTDRFAFGKDYAQTLRIWLESFEKKIPQIHALGFDDAFIRIWRFYLAVCIAGFTSGRINVVQKELSPI